MVRGERPVSSQFSPRGQGNFGYMVLGRTALHTHSYTDIHTFLCIKFKDFRGNSARINPVCLCSSDDHHIVHCVFFFVTISTIFSPEKNNV